FQILKDLIPPNDQKRDKASLLLERSCAQMESFIDHPDIMKSGSRHENVFQPMRNEQKSPESNFSGDAAHRGKDLLSGSDTSAVPLGVPYQQSIHRSGTGVLPSDTIACQPLLQTCWSKPSTSECPIAGSSSNETKTKTKTKKKTSQVSILTVHYRNPQTESLLTLLDLPYLLDDRKDSRASNVSPLPPISSGTSADIMKVGADIRKGRVLERKIL
ncbi:hypothetical protein Droror1_Dr00025478, partial [Drosera rotundifolia]